jgi:hypothetical protein
VESLPFDLQANENGIWSGRYGLASDGIVPGDYTYLVAVQGQTEDDVTTLGQGGLPSPDAPALQLTVPEGVVSVFFSYNRLNGVITAVPYVNQIDAQIDGASTFPLDPQPDGTFAATLNVGVSTHTLQIVVDNIPVGPTYEINGDPAGWASVVARRNEQTGEWEATPGPPVQPASIIVRAIDPLEASLPGACFAIFDLNGGLVGQECDESDGADGTTTIPFPNGIADGTYRLAVSQPGSDRFSVVHDVDFPRADAEPIVVTIETG